MSSDHPVAALDAGAALADLLTECEEQIGYRFRDKNLLRAALTHTSGADHRLGSNERLEFLGDSILGAVVCELLFRRYDQFMEGDLTKVKSIVVSRQSCASMARDLGLERYLIMGRGITAHPGVPASLLADALESLVGAIFLDGGPAEAWPFLQQLLEPEIERVVGGELGANYKSQLQQVAQRERGLTPTYHLLDEKGPDHSKCFKIAAQIGAMRYQAAWGPSKKEAEQRAALNALSQLGGIDPPYPSD